jgi:hypothetical protein
MLPLLTFLIYRCHHHGKVMFATAAKNVTHMSQNNNTALARTFRSTDNFRAFFPLIVFLSFHHATFQHDEEEPAGNNN